jgi:hypothetical protein
MMYHLASRYVLSWFEKDAFLREYLKDHTQRYFERRKTQMQALEYYDPRSPVRKSSVRSSRRSSLPKIKAITDTSPTDTPTSQKDMSKHVEVLESESEEEFEAESSESETEITAEDEMHNINPNDELQMYYMYGSITDHGLRNRLQHP